MPSKVTAACLNGMVSKGLLPPLTSVEEWIPADSEAIPDPPPGYVVSFVVFHERGLRVPPLPFFVDLLRYYDVLLHHLTPNNIHHLSAFVALCEGYLGIEPHFNLWRYFFKVQLETRADGKPSKGGPRLAKPYGCADIRFHADFGGAYLPTPSPPPTKGGRRGGSI